MLKILPTLICYLIYLTAVTFILNIYWNIFNAHAYFFFILCVQKTEADEKTHLKVFKTEFGQPTHFLDTPTRFEISFFTINYWLKNENSIIFRHKTLFSSFWLQILRGLYLATYTLPGPKLVVRPRFEPWICCCQSFMLLRLLEVEKFQAQKFVHCRRKNRFSRSDLKLIKNGFWTRYLHYLNIYKIYKLITKRPFVVFWEIILHFSNRLSANCALMILQDNILQS